MIKYIPNEILKAFTSSFEKDDIWQIHTGDKWLIVFLYSESQIKDNKDRPIYQQIKDEYFKLVEKYLEVQVSGVDDISLKFDSKENFENKYQGNWHFYYR